MTIITIGVLVLLLLGVLAAKRSRGGKKTPQADIMKELRHRALHLAPEEVGIHPSGDTPWGIVMDTTYPEGSASLVALEDGTASLYFSGGGGVIGGHAHES